MAGSSSRDAQQFLVVGFDIGKQPNFLQELQRKALRLVDNQNRRLAAAVAVAQKRLEFDQHRRL